jgi:phosphohistidine swiveling domain-containing protein
MKPHGLEGFSWTKNWAGKWPLLECCHYGREYTDCLEARWGVGLDCAVFVFEGDRSSNYVGSDRKERFARQLAKKMVEDGYEKEWPKDIKKKVDEILAFLRETQGRGEEEYRRLWELLDGFLVLNFPMKTLDYMPKEMQERLLPELERARVYGEPVYEESMRFMREIAQLVADEADVSIEMILCMTSDEFEQFYSTKEMPPISALEERRKTSAIVVRGKNVKVCTGQDAKRTLAAMTPRTAGDLLSGTTAYPGKVKGHVRVILDPSKVGILPPGSVLVTGMTRPEYLHLFKSATAVVTDAGGMLSHAAITARELKIPCVVGTETATRILKDGDMVEVDADRGIVRKLQ